MSYREPPRQVDPIFVTFNGRVTALDHATGKELWSHVVDSPAVMPKMLADDTCLYVLTATALTAVDGRTGAGVWRTTLPFESATMGWHFALHGERVFLWGGGRLYAYARQGGALLWETRCSDAAFPAP